MTLYSTYRSKHATLSTTVADTVYFTKPYARSMLVTNRDASTLMYFNENPGSETQTVTLSGGTAAETFKLTWGGTEATVAVTIPAGGYANVTAALMQACINSVTGIASGDVTVTKSTNDYAFNFAGGLLRGADVGAITITSKVGAANGSVAETTKGGAVAASGSAIAVPGGQSVVIDLESGGSGGGLLCSLVGSGNAYSVTVL